MVKTFINVLVIPLTTTHTNSELQDTLADKLGAAELSVKNRYCFGNVCLIGPRDVVVETLNHQLS